MQAPEQSFDMAVLTVTLSVLFVAVCIAVLIGYGLYQLFDFN